ncbi:hypothetical protein ACMYYO_04125 [Dermacoccaceae bacterium W4C1]
MARRHKPERGRFREEAGLTGNHDTAESGWDDSGFDFEEHARRGPGRRVLGCLIPLALVAGIGVGGWQAYVHLENYFGRQTCLLKDGTSEEKLDPEQAANAATIADVGVGVRGLPYRAAHIAITTAIQESKLRNLNSGDRDSLGLFQQRPSQGWGTEEEILNPVYASSEFYRHLVKVQDWRTDELTDVAQAVQRSGHPLAYADHEGEGNTMATVLTGTSGTVGCRLGDAGGSGDPQATSRKLLQQTGIRAQVTDGGLTARADSAASARMVASWAVTHAQFEEITSVTVGDRSWTRQRGKAGWDWQAAENPSGSSQIVRITFAR